MFVPGAAARASISVATRFIMLVRLRSIKRVYRNRVGTPTTGGVHIILHPHGRTQGGIGDAGPGVVSVSGAL